MFPQKLGKKRKKSGKQQTGSYGKKPFMNGFRLIFAEVVGAGDHSNQSAKLDHHHTNGQQRVRRR